MRIGSEDANTSSSPPPPLAVPPQRRGRAAPTLVEDAATSAAVARHAVHDAMAGAALALQGDAFNCKYTKGQSGQLVNNVVLAFFY